jgi:hypothetical protein
MYVETEVRALLYAHSYDMDRVETLMTGSLGGVHNTPLPWSGKVRSSDCQGLRMNHGLFTQCGNPKKIGDYCTTCTKSSESNGGTPVHGTVSQRLDSTPGNYSVIVNGKVRVETPYKEVIAKLKFSEEHVRAVAYAAGITLPEDTFGKCIGDAVAKIQPEKETGIIATLVETARAAPPTRTEIAKASASTLRTWCQSYAIQPGTKKVMQERLRTELGYNTASEIPVTSTTVGPGTKPVTSTTVGPSTKAVTSTTVGPGTKAVASTTVGPGTKAEELEVATTTEEVIVTKELTAVLNTSELPNGEMASIDELSEEEYEEEEHICDLFTDSETGIQYLKNAEGDLFDKTTKEEVGTLHGENVHLYRVLDAQVNA